MSKSYDRYLVEHKKNVAEAYRWLDDNIPSITQKVKATDAYRILYEHDRSKYSKEEYDAYDKYFSTNIKKTSNVCSNFDVAWLHHIHNNPHHWEHWIIPNYDPKRGITCVDMPYHYIVEMICDWWSFSWKSGDLNEMFEWYSKNSSFMLLTPRTRKQVECILRLIENKLIEISKRGTADDSERVSTSCSED